jgi:hypothetical protein
MIDAETIENAKKELYNIFCGMSREELDNLRYTDCCHEGFKNNTLIEWVDEGASKFVFSLSVRGFNNYVFKIPFKGELYRELEKDYCEFEKDLYFYSKTLGFEDLLAKTSFVGVILDIPVYIAERVRPMTDFFDLEDFPISNLSKSVVREIVSNSDYMFADLPAREHLEKFVEDHGEYKTYSLIDFILKYGLGDFHPGNVGIKKNGKICLLDYSGFED